MAPSITSIPYGREVLWSSSFVAIAAVSSVRLRINSQDGPILIIVWNFAGTENPAARRVEAGAGQAQFSIKADLEQDSSSAQQWQPKFQLSFEFERTECWYRSVFARPQTLSSNVVHDYTTELERCPDDMVNSLNAPLPSEKE